MSGLNLKFPCTCEVVALKDIRFAVPIYQRLFVWGEEQVVKLLDDIKRATFQPRPKPYYIVGVDGQVE